MRKLLWNRRLLGIGTLVCLVIFGVWILSNFRRTYSDLTREVARNTVRLPTPAGVYHQVAWLTDEQVAILYEPTKGFSGYNKEIVLFSLDTHVWNTLTVPKPSECRVASPQLIQRLPNRNLGFVYSCLVDRGGYDDEFNSLYEWDLEAASPRLLQRYPANFHAGRFAFSPDMLQLIQEQPVGSGMDNELYRGIPPKALEQLFPTWKRVSTPAWSPDSSLIAFTGTETYKDRKPLHPLFAFGPMVDVLYYPWDLYVMEPGDKAPQLLLPGVVGAFVHGWKPGSKQLTFSGEYQRTEGIWVVDIGNRHVTRIWPYKTAFDWSPDGRQMLLESETYPGMSSEPLIIVNVPGSSTDK